MSLLIVTCILFVGSHLLLSPPLRAPLAGRMGERAFQIVDSVVAIATLILVVQAWRGMPPEPPLWAVDDPLWALASLIILFASILFMGSLVGNPALPVRGAAFAAQAAPRGVRSEEHTSELQSLMRISYAVFCLKKQKNHKMKLRH